jgi:hypothetical protein
MVEHRFSPPRGLPHPMSPRASLRVEGSPPRSGGSLQPCTGTATESGHGSRTRGPVTDRAAPEDQELRQRLGQGQGQRQRGARYGHGTRTRPPATGSVTDRAVAGHLVLRCTGLPSRSALVAPPFRLAALRWREVIFIFVRIQPPPSVSTACLVAVTHVPGGHSRGSPTRYCAHRNSNAIGTIPCTARPPVREFSCSVEVVILVPREAMKWRIGDVGRPGPTGAVPGIRRSLSGRRRALSPSAVPGSATRVAENQRQRQVQRQRRRQGQRQGQRRGPVRPRCPDTAPGHRGRSRTEPHRKTRSCGSVWDRSSDSGSPEARCGHGDRSSVTGSVTDQGVAENQRQGQRQGQHQRQ